MKAIIQSFIIAAVATAITACTAEESLAPQADQPITVMATVPGEVWATASRASSMGTLDKTDYSEVELHYTDYKGVAATHKVPLNTIEFSVANSANSFWFTTGSDLVWEKVDATKPIHLTCKEGDASFHTSVESAEPGEALTFTDAMKPTMAKLTVKLTFTHNITGELQALNATITTAGAATDYHPQTDGGIHQTDGTAAAQSLALEANESDNVFTSSMLLPEQTMGNMLTVTYGSDITWTLDLSQVKVKDTDPVQYANQLIAGQHLTLNLKASVTSLNAPTDVQIEAFTKADATDYEGDLGGAVNYFYDAATNTYLVYNKQGLIDIQADMEVNGHTDAIVVYNGVSLKLENGEFVLVDNNGNTLPTIVIDCNADSEDLESIITAAISVGKTNLFVVGESINLVGSCIKNSGATEGTINLILADATSIEAYAFEDCSALKSVNLPKVTMVETLAFYQCQKLTSVNLPKAKEIGNSAFEYCTALKSVNLPNATWIRIAAFKRCQELTSVDLPNATSIEEQAFYECEKLTSVNFPKVTSIEYGTFEFCSALTSVNFPEVTSIGDQAFMDCTALKSVNLPKATSIGYGAFWTCRNLTSLTFGTVITVVGENSFKDVPNGDCDLTLAAGQLNTGLAPSGNSWAGYTWKSITIK